MFKSLKFILVFAVFSAIPLTTRAAFVASSTTFVAVQDGAMAWGDYDGDGRLDLLYTGLSGSGAVVELYRNDGGSGPTMTDVTSSALVGITGVYRSSVAWGDFNNDGKLDFAYCGVTDGGDRLLQVWRQTSSGTFELFANLTGVEQGALAWADVTGSGYLSLLVCGATQASNAGLTFDILRNNSGASFTSLSPGLTGAYLRLADIVAADVDLDGDVDFAVMGLNGSSVRVMKVYKNNGVGAFTDTSQSFAGLDQGGLALADMNGDGYPDLAASGSTDSGRALRIHVNAVGTIETSASITMAGLSGGKVAFGDVNGDGAMDLAVTGDGGSSKVSKVYVNASNSYSETGTMITLTGATVSSSSLAWADVDSDGDLDVFVIGLDSSSIGSLYLNDAGSQSIPTVPTSGFTTTMVGGILTLQWGNGGDSQTSTPSLGYQVRVGTSSGGSQAATAVYGTPLLGSNYPSRISSGQPGRIFQSFPSNVIIYWSVRTIDGGFRVSGWSSEQAFYTGGALTVSGGQGAHVIKGKETILKSGVVKGPNGEAVSGVPVLFTVTKPDGEVLTPYSGTTDATGQATVTVPADETTQPGIYLVAIEGSNITIAKQSISFISAVENKPEITVAPNPFTPTKAPWNKAGFILRDRVAVSADLKIFEIGGAMIRKVSFGSGENAEWDGKDEAGNTVEGGIYLWQITFSGKNVTGTVVVAR